MKRAFLHQERRENLKYISCRKRQFITPESMRIFCGGYPSYSMIFCNIRLNLFNNRSRVLLRDIFSYMAIVSRRLLGPLIKLTHPVTLLDPAIVLYHEVKYVLCTYLWGFAVVICNPFKHIALAINNFSVEPPCSNPETSASIVSQNPPRYSREMLFISGRLDELICIGPIS